MTQTRRGPSDFYQILVFLIILILLLAGLVVGGSGGQPAPTPTPITTAEATAVSTVEATAPATTEPTAEVTLAIAVEPRVFFIEPADNATVPPKFTVQMGAQGLTIEPAGEIHEGAGHFHILIDTPFIEAGQVIPKDDTHLHFGQGQTETELELTPGTHVLRLQFANGAHIALDGDQYRAEITINVEASS